MRNRYGAPTQMYFAVVALFLFVLPAVSVLAEMFVFKTGLGTTLLVGKWFVFWAVGVRLFTAGARQAIQPEFTTNEIFGIKGREALVIVQELGFANISLGVLGMVSLAKPGWVLPAAVAGGLYYGLAGVRHLFSKGRNRLENVATYSDLFICVVLLGFAGSRIGN